MLIKRSCFTSFEYRTISVVCCYPVFQPQWWMLHVWSCLSESLHNPEMCPFLRRNVQVDELAIHHKEKLLWVLLGTRLSYSCLLINDMLIICICFKPHNASVLMTVKSPEMSIPVIHWHLYNNHWSAACSPVSFPHIEYLPVWRTQTWTAFSLPSERSSGPRLSGRCLHIY